MSSNDVDLVSRPYIDDVDLVSRPYIDVKSREFVLIERIERRLERLSDSFLELKNISKDNERFLFLEISYCFRDIANDFREFKSKINN